MDYASADLFCRSATTMVSVGIYPVTGIYVFQSRINLAQSDHGVPPPDAPLLGGRGRNPVFTEASLYFMTTLLLEESCLEVAMLAIHFPVLAMLVPTCSLIFLVDLLGKHSSRFRRRSFLIRHLLRSPGESLRVQLEHLNRKVAAYVAATLTFPLLIYFACMALLNEHTPAGIAWLVVEVIAVMSCIVHVARKLLSLLGQKRGVMMELETKMAVAQELNALVREGYLVFHDIPCAGFNIAHVVVGRTGVYALETRAFTKADGKGDEENWDVAYSGNTLRFPGWRETSAIEQALFHAVWLQTSLSKAVGEDVAVHPVLVIPGWYVDQQGNGRVKVSNGKNIQALLGLLEPNCPPLSVRKIRRIEGQLDLRCRQHVARSGGYPVAAERESCAEAA